MVGPAAGAGGDSLALGPGDATHASSQGPKFPGRVSWAGPGGGMLVLPRGGVGSAGPRSSSYPVSPTTAALEVGARGLRWTGASAAAESLLTLAGPSALAGCSQAGMTKPGGLKLVHLSPWVYDDQSLSARNSFARTPQLLNAYTHPFSCPSLPPKLSSPAWPDARLASVPWGWLSPPPPEKLIISEWTSKGPWARLARGLNTSVHTNAHCC